MKHFGRNKEVQIKAMYCAALIVAVITLLVTSVPVHASKMDNRIESSARESFVFKTFLQGDDIKIQSKDGAVTLTGIVASDINKSLAQETVASLPGVESVENRLEVKHALPTPNSDAWLKMKVKTILFLHRSLRDSKTEVNVNDGIVTLQGEAASQSQKELTTEYAKDVEGVKDVNNEMTVTKPPKKTQTAGEKIDDASITAQVKMSLLYHRSTSALNTKVETKRGVVTLYGKASNAAEKDLAAKLAKDVNGVKDVKNRMTIE
jgi:hyperosmotically inducible protein